MKLVIVESPAKAKTIGKFLGKTYRVEACNGHVRDLPKSQTGVDVKNNFEPKYITIRGRGKILEKVRKQAKAATRIYLATDPDREGEAISWHLAQTLGIEPEKANRVVFHEITKQAVKSAMEHPRPLNMNLVNAQQARRILDRLVGYSISPLLWNKLKKGLSAGRVQSVATRMVCDREAEIDAFLPEEYWTMQGAFETADKQAITAKLRAEIKNRAAMEAAEAGARQAEFIVSSVKKSERKRNPAAPFTTSQLQQEASRKLNFTTAKTMQVAQELYEGIDLEKVGTVGLVTYIRTDSTRVADEAMEAVRAYIPERYGEAYLPGEPNVYKGRKNAQDAHEAIRPADVTLRPEQLKASMTRDQFRLYKLIHDRFVASQMTSALYDVLTVTFKGGDYEFAHQGQRMTFAGYTAVYVEGVDEEEEKQSEDMPLCVEGQKVTLTNIESQQHFTQPPQRYTEATLVRAMEEKGIGRPSTYAPTITTIITRGYVAREAKRLHPTELGQMVTEMMTKHFSDIVDIAFTANLEEKLDDVEEDGADWRKILGEFYGPFEKTLEKAEQSIEKVEIKDEVSDVVCDKCGAMMVYKTGRFGRFLACPKYPECKNTKALVKELDVPCPLCGKALIERMSKKGRRFYGCAAYPDCSFVSWDRPVAEKCSECGSYMVLKPNKTKEVLLCANEACRHRVERPKAEDGGEKE